MSRMEKLRGLLDAGIVAIVRAQESDYLAEAATALAEGGVSAIEVTFTVPNALQVIHQVRARLGDRVLLGAGTVLDPETARSATRPG